MGEEPGVIKVNENTKFLDMAEENNSGDSREEYKYGCGDCTPSSLQCCTSLKVLVLWLCLLALVQGFLVNGITNVNVSTIERRYDLPSSQVGFIASAYEISGVLLSLPIVIYGTHGHQPRMMAIGALTLGVGSFIMLLPQLTEGPYELGERPPESCNIHGNSTSCEERSYLSNYLWVFVLGMLINGFGGSVIYTLGVVLIDSNVKTHDGPLYQGLFYASSTLGPAIGYIGGGQLLDIYVDFYRQSDSVSIGPSDPRWVGAWWIGFAVAAVLCVCLSVVLIFYPREMPGTAEVRKNKKSEAHQDGSESITNKSDFGKSIKDVPLAIKLLLCNPTSMLITLGALVESFLVNGFATFLPKFFETQYGQTASRAALLAGVLVVPGAAGGEFLGGLVAKVLKLSVKSMLRMCSLLCFGGMLMSFVFLVLNCEKTPLTGVDVEYLNNSSLSSGGGNLSHACNSGCGCSTSSYEPICGVDGNYYFSACHAGCQSYQGQGDAREYFNCTCIQPVSVNLSLYDKLAVPGNCSSACTNMYIFMPLLLVLMLFTFMILVPGVSANLRCIPYTQRALMMGFRLVMIRGLGSIPGPIVLGAIFDRACLVWQENCNRTGSCWVYERNHLALYITILVIAVKAVSCASFFLASRLYKPPQTEEIEKDVKLAENVAMENRDVANA